MREFHPKFGFGLTLTSPSYMNHASNSITIKIKVTPFQKFLNTIDQNLCNLVVYGANKSFPQNSIFSATSRLSIAFEK